MIVFLSFCFSSPPPGCMIWMATHQIVQLLWLNGQQGFEICCFSTLPSPTFFSTLAHLVLFQDAVHQSAHFTLPLWVCSSKTCIVRQTSNIIRCNISGFIQCYDETDTRTHRHNVVAVARRNASAHERGQVCLRIVTIVYWHLSLSSVMHAIFIYTHWNIVRAVIKADLGHGAAKLARGIQFHCVAHVLRR